MPYKNKRPCSFPGCPELVHGRYCEEHKKLYKEERPSASYRGYDSRWRKASKIFLKKNPICKNCEREGKLIKANVVDHITPHRGDKELFWEVSNWQPLCKSCHDKKTMTEDRFQEFKY